MQQANNMGDLHFLRENFTGTYVPEIPRNAVLDLVLKDYGCPRGTHEGIADGLMRLDFNISPNYEFQLIDHNERTIRFHINTPRDSFWFEDFTPCQSIARYDNYTLIIEMIPQMPTARRATYQFYEQNGMKGIKFEMFNGTTSWTILYKKIS